MINYLTELLGKPVLEPDGRKVARVLDAIAAQGDRLPTLAALYCVNKDNEIWVSVEDAEITDEGIRLRVSWDAVTEYTPQPTDLRLQRDILDKQIVDVHDYRVVRVNDVRLATCGDRYCVVGADASLRAIFRRAGVSKPIEAFAKAIKKPLHSKLISWDDVETLEPGSAGGGRIKLKIPHEKIARLHPADIADIVEQLTPQQRAEVIEALDVETAADTIEEMEDEEAAAIMSTLEVERAADIVEEMNPDEAADILADLSDYRTEELLDHMEAGEAAEVMELLAYHEDTAGGLMTTEFLAIEESLTAERTIATLRELAPRAESIYYLYVVDEDGRLAGVISLRDLVVAKPETLISEFMVRNVRCVYTTDHADDIAHMISRYNLLALPVVDEDRILRGIITVDDMMERLLPPEKRRRLPQVTLDSEVTDE